MRTSLTYKLAKLMRNHRQLNAHENKAVMKMREEIAELGNGIQFTVSTYPDGTWSAKSTNVDGIITGGRNVSEMSEVLKDAIFTYYEIPPQYCDDSMLKGIGEKKTVKKEAFVTT